MGQYWVQVPRRRQVVETYTNITYTLSPEGVRGFFMEMVERAISNTEAALAGYVRAYVERQVEAGRRAIEEYSQR